MNNNFPLATSTWDEAEYNALNRVIESGRFTMGEEVKRFEEKFAAYVGSRYAVMVNSGSSANLLMTASLFYTSDLSLRLNPGDEVIVPAVSWATTYTPLHQYGLKLKFVDIDLYTLNYDINKLNEAVSDKTRAIMVVNLLGNPNEFSHIREIIAGKNIILLEDNCESLGATYLGQQAGTFGLMGTYSAFFSHHISTMEGGVLVTNNEELYHIALAMRAHGWTRNLPDVNFVCGEKKKSHFEESFRFVLPGYNLRPLELSGAVGVEQVKKLPHLISVRRENAKKLQALLSDHPKLFIQKEIGNSSWFGFSLVVKQGSLLSRDVLIQKLESYGFESRPIVAGNFANKEVVKYFNYEISGSLDAADYIDKNGLFIGNHSYAMNNELDALKQLLNEKCM